MKMDYVQGIDVSKWQGMMNWNKAFQAGARFAFIRAGSISNTEGICYTDDQFERNADLAPSVMPVGFYWYFRPNHDAYKQADYFYDLIKVEDYKLPPVIDIEDPGGMSTYYIVKRLFQFVERITALAGVPPMIYTSPGFANPFLGSPDWLGDLPLWVAHWTLLQQPTLPVAWSSWLFWQYSGDENNLGLEYGAQSRAIDRNRFNGDADDFAAYIDGEIIEVPPHEIFLPYIARVNAPAGLFTRATPEIANNKRGALFHNTEVTVVEEDGAWRKCRAEYWSHGDYLIPA